MQSGDTAKRAEMQVAASAGSGQNPPEAEEGVSRPSARKEPPRPQTQQMMEAVVERENMLRALRQVEANKGSPGVDRVTVEDLKKD